MKWNIWIERDKNKQNPSGYVPAMHPILDLGDITLGNKQG